MKENMKKNIMIAATTMVGIIVVIYVVINLSLLSDNIKSIGNSIMSIVLGSKFPVLGWLVAFGFGLAALFAYSYIAEKQKVKILQSKKASEEVGKNDTTSEQPENKAEDKTETLKKASSNAGEYDMFVKPRKKVNEYDMFSSEDKA